MRDRDDAALELRLREVLKEHLGALPLDLTVESLDRRREARGGSRRLGRGRGMTLLAAAALLLVGGALAAGSGLVRRPAVVPPVPAPSLAAVVIASPDALSPGPSNLARLSASPIPAAPRGGTWIATGSMTTPRHVTAAVRLLDGRVLVAGGQSSDGSDLTSAELYDPSTGAWTPTRSMIHPGSGPATLLVDGSVLVQDHSGDVAGAELYDPATGTWSMTRSQPGADGYVAATLLSDGRVLVVDRYAGAGMYDPVSGTWSRTGPMVVPREDTPTMIRLPDGRVFVGGGWSPGDGRVSSAEVYDPQTSAWTAVANTGFFNHAVTLLQDGTLLVLGEPIPQLFNPATGAWTRTQALARPDDGPRNARGTRLLDGTVLVAGEGPDGRLAQVYDPATQSWSVAGSMMPDPWGAVPDIRSATLLGDGTVLVAGGSCCLATQTGTRAAAISSAELYVPAGATPPDLGPLSTPAPPAPTPSPTPVPTPLPPEAGPVPAGARSWTVTVVNKSSDPATLFLATEGETGVDQLCGSVTPNVVPAGVTRRVTFLLPPKRMTDCWVWVDPVPGQGGSLFQTSDAPMAGKILVGNGEGGDSQGGWLGQ